MNTRSDGEELVGALSAALAATAGVGGLTELISVQWAGGLAIASAVAGAVAASLGAPQSKEKAAVAGNAYRALQQDVRIFIKIDLPTTAEPTAREQLGQFVSRLQQLNAEAELPSDKAWKRAKDNVEQRGAQNYEVD